MQLSVCTECAPVGKKGRRTGGKVGSPPDQKKKKEKSKIRKQGALEGEAMSRRGKREARGSASEEGSAQAPQRNTST